MDTTVKIGISGSGRIGRLAFRCIIGLGEKSSDVKIVAVNNLTTLAPSTHLLKHDSTYGTFSHEVSATEDSTAVDGKKYRVCAEPQVQSPPWVKNDGINFALECTGFYTNKAKSQTHLDAGAKRVLVSAPAGNDFKAIVYSVSDDTLTADDRIVSAGSCTANSLAPMASALNKELGVGVGTTTIIHAFTLTQVILDGPVRGGNFCTARISPTNIISYSTGAAKAIGLITPESNGELQGHAQHIPVVGGLETELVSVLSEKVTADEVNTAMKKYESASFAYDDNQIVSSGILGMTAGSTFDLTQTEVITTGGKQLVKTVAWYDNEYSFTCQMVRTLLKFATLQSTVNIQ